MTGTDTSKKVHHGRNIKRFREMFGLKQEALAIELGPDWSQKKVSRLEENETIDEDVLQQVAAVLKVPVDAIKRFDEQTALSFIGNTYTNNDYSATLNGWTVQYNPTIHPIEKILELVEENKKLYERLLTAEKEKVVLLEKLLEQKK